MSQTLTLSVEGMTCASCVRRVERALAAVPGVAEASVNLATGQATVSSAAEGAALVGLGHQAAQAVERAGYASQLVVDEAQETEAPVETSGRDVALAALLSAPLVAPMLVAPLGYHFMLPGWAQFVLATVVLAWFGRRFFIGAYKAVRGGGANMDVLVALGTAAAWGLSTWLWRRDPEGSAHSLYYESAAVVIALVLLGKWLEARAKRSTLDALQALRKLRPESAMRRRDGVITRVPLSDVRVGDEIIVAAGERLAVDAMVIDGRSHVDESLLTGESVPVAKEPGSAVVAGSINGEGQLGLRTTAIGAQTSLGRIVKMVESAQARKPPIQQLVDRVAEWFVPAVMVVAVLTLIGWKLAGAPTPEAIIHAVSVLVIACPCALGLATPTALMVGTGLAAEQGVLVRDARAFEALHRVKLAAFDKTGTLTKGQPRVTDVHTVSPAIDAHSIVQTAAALQTGSKHPLARAVQEAAAQSGSASLMEAVDVRVVPGRGVEGTVNGASMRLGSDLWMQELSADCSPLRDAADAARAKGQTVSWLAVQQGTDDAARTQVLAMLAFGDEPRQEAKRMVSRLRELGVRSALVSGDNRAAADALAAQLGIDEVRAPVLPADKATVVRGWREAITKADSEGGVAMIGDGINDAPALAAADVGIAMGTGTDVAMETAGLTLMHGDVALVPTAIELSRAVSSKIRQNLFWAFAYNVIGIPMAALGMLSPMVAGAAMAMSSVSVVANALLLRRWKPKV